MSWQLAIVLKPFILLLLFSPGAVASHAIRRHMPQGRFKDILLISWRV